MKLHTHAKFDIIESVDEKMILFENGTGLIFDKINGKSYIVAENFVVECDGKWTLSQEHV